jgi:hypothetical protein
MLVKAMYTAYRAGPRKKTSMTRNAGKMNNMPKRKRLRRGTVANGSVALACTAFLLNC